MRSASSGQRAAHGSVLVAGVDIYFGGYSIIAMSRVSGSARARWTFLSSLGGGLA